MIIEEVTKQNAGQSGMTFKLVIENNNYKWDRQYITGEEIRNLAGLSNESLLLLAVTEPWNDQPIGNDDKVDLGRPDIEHFYFRRNLKLVINKKPFEWQREFISGRQIKQLGSVSMQDQLFLTIEKPGEDELITDEAKVNLALPGVEHFYSSEVDKEVIIIVNGVPKKWEKKQITFKEVIILADGIYIDRPTMIYTVAYEDGPKENPEGSMTKESVVFVKDKMIFHATATDKS
jgi:hypothetical protein